MKRLIAIQHTEFERLGSIESALSARKIEVECVHSYAGQTVPKSMDGYSGLVVMGGPMGVYEKERYPFLKDEMTLIEGALSDSKPILGVCLGSQLLAAVLGANVTRGPRREIGWHPIYLTDVSSSDLLWHGAPATFTGFHWHGDVFDVPAGSVSLAYSDQTACQAFRYGKNAYGFLFHMEVTEAIVGGIVEAFPEEIEEAGCTRSEIESRCESLLPQLQLVGKRVFSEWSGLL